MMSYKPRGALTIIEEMRREVEAHGDSPATELGSIDVPSGSGGGTAAPLTSTGGKVGSGVFRTSKMIGEGGMGEVWEAVQVNLERLVAVKRLKRTMYRYSQEIPGQAEAYELAFRQEALTTANLDHPNIVPVHDLGFDEDGSPLMAMKLIRGRPWHDLIWEDWRDQSLHEMLERHIPILIAVANAVAFAHSRGVVHRDLKPAQVMVGEFGEVLLADWGLAVVTDHCALAQCDQRATTSFLPTPDSASNPAGTPAFMAPEQTLDHARLIGTWTDVYLLGGTLYYILTLTPPHLAGDPQESFQRARLGEITRPSLLAPELRIPEELDRLVAEAMDPEPEKRIPSAKAFVARLHEFLSGTSRRREADELATRARGLLEVETPSYQPFGEILSLLSRAASLWPDNPHHAALRQVAYRRFARLALDSGDLKLARLQAGNLTDETERERVLSEVQDAECDLAKRELQRRMAVWGVIALLALVIVGGSIFALELKRGRDDARVERDRARAARADAEALVTLLQTDLRETLEPIQQLQPLLQVGVAAEKYFESLDPMERTLQTDEQWAMASRSVGLVLFRMGRGQEALESFRRFNRLARGILEREPNDPKWVRALCESYIWMGFLAGRQGIEDVEQLAVGQAIMAASALHAGTFGRQTLADLADPEKVEEYISMFAPAGSEGDPIARWDAILVALNELVELKPGKEPQWNTGVAWIFEWAGRRFREARRYDDAERAFRRALELRVEVERQPNAPPENATGIVEVWLSLGDLALERGDLSAGEDAYGIAVQQALEGGEQGSVAAFQWGGVLVRSYRGLASVLWRSGRGAEALTACADALDYARRLVAYDPRNADSLEQYAQTLITQSNAYLTENEYAAAERSLREGLNIFEELLGRDQRNVAWRKATTDALVSAAELLDAREADEGTSATLELVGDLAARRARLATILSSDPAWPTFEDAVTQRQRGAR